MPPPTTCDTCSNYSYDPDYEYYVCVASLDEDDLVRFLGNSRFQCPFYQQDDEYKIVRKQL